MPTNTTIYHVNCHALLSDDICYKIAFNADTSRLNITLVDPDKAPEAYSSAEGYITDYIRCAPGLGGSGGAVAPCPAGMTAEERGRPSLQGGPAAGHMVEHGCR